MNICGKEAELDMRVRRLAIGSEAVCMIHVTGTEVMKRDETKREGQTEVSGRCSDNDLSHYCGSRGLASHKGSACHGVRQDT
jgi:hypothetical protein